MAATLENQPTTFPEEWNAPVDGSATFLFDPMHFPFPISPLTHSAMGPAFGAGFTQAAREYHSQIRKVVVTSRNMYRFLLFDMARPADWEESRRIAEAAEAAMTAQFERLVERWDEEHLPAIRRHIKRLQEMVIELRSAEFDAIVLAEVDTILRDLWTIHFRIVMPLSVAIQVFDDFYADVFGGEEGDGHTLLAGMSSESVRAGLSLSDLAVLAKDLGLETVFRDTASNDVLEALGKTEAGRTFASELRMYLETYGLRQDLIDFITPTWRENPAIALSIVGNYLVAGHDARAESAAHQRSAEEALAAARADLAGYPEAVRNQFEEVVSVGRAAAFLKEEHNFYIDQTALSLVRLVYLEMGCRLAEMGVLATADDIFMLHVEELPVLFVESTSAHHIDQTRSLVQTRRDQMQLAQALTPPPFIGPPPPESPPAGGLLARARLRLYGELPRQTDATNQLNGHAGSRGIVSGIAFVASTLEEATALRPGEILVAVTTMPAWTPLFGIAVAVVTETGGPLSHCAIIAREYGIPAVVGARGATRVISTGQRITVDGGRGILTMDD
ncbi:MAG: PEP-utilizing enzyme [Chloroflexota bacterium]|nr:PEP-utilizing enzyme [Chloroflexota bacterium]